MSNISENLQKYNCIESVIYIKEEHDNINIKEELNETDYTKENQIDLSITFTNNLDNNSYKLNNSVDEQKIEINKVYLEDQYLSCERCNEAYDEYCYKCPMLLQVLDNVAEDISVDSPRATLPNNILSIRESFDRLNVFARKIIPQDIIFGPFYGLDFIKVLMGTGWKLKDKKLTMASNNNLSNWMQYVDSTENISEQNILLIRFQDNLYFQSTRLINIDEELLIYFNEDHIRNLEDGDEMYYDPTKRKFENSYACVFCCLGFSLEEYLVKHKTKCPYVVQDDSLGEILQCAYCKIYLYSNEYLKHHVTYCEKYMRNIDYADQHNNITTTSQIEENRSNFVGKYKKYKCDRCVYETDYRAVLRQHLDSHKGIKGYECKFCKKKFTRKQSLKVHAEIHTNTSDKFKCNECDFESNRKTGLKLHLATHQEIKKYTCELCDKSFMHKFRLTQHMKTTHRNIPLNIFKCTECDFGTDTHLKLREHRYIHNSKNTDRQFQCKVCEKEFKTQRYLTRHTTNMHAKEMKYCCDKCTYATNQMSNFKQHVNRHDALKQHECTICNKQYTQKEYLRAHVKNTHTNVDSKKFKCTSCPYETNYNQNFKSHVSSHEAKLPVCNVCSKEFQTLPLLEKHMRGNHDMKFERDLKCAQCDYQTDFKKLLRQHMRVHNGKPYACDSCKECFNRKQNLERHILNRHTLKDGEKYKCPQCTFTTNYTRTIQSHLLMHKGVKEFTCEICNKNYSGSEDLKRHRKRKHSNEKNKKK